MIMEVKTTAAPTAQGAYSQAVVANGIMYTAGIGPYDPTTGGIVGIDIVTQTRQVMENLTAVLGARGLGFDAVIKSTVHLQNVERDFDAFDAVYSGYLAKPYPVRTTVGSRLRGILIEVDMIAALNAVGR